MRRIITAFEQVAVWQRDGAWHHSTDAELNPGDEILSATQRGYASPNKDMPGYNPNNVHIWHSDGDPVSYDFGEHTYEVEPLGDINRDPEYEHNRRDAPKSWSDDQVPGYHSYVVPRARVKKKLW
jgi:hypothetical protein